MSQETRSGTGLRHVGLIGGLGIGATIQIYESFVAACRDMGFSPLLTITHADVDRVLTFASNGQRTELATYLADLVSTLAGSGAEIAAVPAITPHYCFPDLVGLSPLPLLNMLELTADEIQRRGLSRVALFGTQMSIESRLFGTLDHVEVLLPRKEEIRLIHESYVKLVQDGRGTAELGAVLRDLAHLLVERDGAEAIVLAGTELSLVFDESNTDFPAIDCAKLLVTALVEAARTSDGVLL